LKELINKWIKIAEKACDNYWMLQDDYFREILWYIYDNNFKFSTVSNSSKTSVQELIRELFRNWFYWFEETTNFEVDFESKIRYDVEQLFVEEEDVNEKIEEIKKEIYYTILDKKYNFIEKFVKDALSYTNELLNLKIKYQEYSKELIKNNKLEKEFLGCDFDTILGKVKNEFVSKFNFSEQYERYKNNPIVRAIGGNYYDFLLKKFKEFLVDYLLTNNLKKDEFRNSVKNDLVNLAEKYNKENYYFDILDIEFSFWKEVIKNYESKIENYFRDEFTKYISGSN
jgi:hypothetical protein